MITPEQEKFIQEKVSTYGYGTPGDFMRLAFEHANVEINELQDKIYHESRKAPEVEYKLNHDIECLRSDLATCIEALENIYSRRMSVYLDMSDMVSDQFKEAHAALSKLKSAKTDEKEG